MVNVGMMKYIDETNSQFRVSNWWLEDDNCPFRQRPFGEVLVLGEGMYVST